MSFPDWRFIRSSHLPALVLLSIFGLLTFWLYYEPRLLLDDWAQIVSDSVFGHMQWVEWSRRRPLDWFAHQAIISLFSLNVPVFYLINFFVILGIFFMVYILVDGLLPELRPFGLVVALMSMLYPADYSLTWITMINIRLAWLVTLVGMWLLLEYARHGGWARLALAGLCLFLPLWTYEGSLGFVTTWCLFLVLIFRQASVRRRLALLSPLLLLGLFGVLRVIIRPMLGIGDSNVNSFYDLTFALLWDRLKRMTILAWAWVKPAPELFQRLEWPAPSARAILTGLILIIALCMLVFYVLLRTSRFWEDRPYIALEKSRLAHRLGWTTLFSFGFLLAGYFPILVIYPPNLDDISSRANMYAIPAAAVIITAIIGLAALALARTRVQWKALVWAGVIPLILIGLGVHVRIQQRAGMAWEAQKTIWHTLFHLAPDFEDDTTVVLVLSGYKRLSFGERPPLSAEWEVNHALKVLYQNDSLTGRIYFPGADFYSEATLTPLGVLGARQEGETPYDKTVFVLYSQNDGTLQLVKDLSSELALPFPVPTYDPQNRIKQTPKASWRYRYLVGVNSE